MSNDPLAEVRALLKAGDAATALTLATAGKLIAEAEFGASDPRTAIALLAVAEVELGSGDLSASIERFDRVISQLTSSHLRNCVPLTDAYEGLGLAHAARGDAVAAESAYCKAIELRERDLGVMHPLVALALERLANFYSEGHFESLRAEPLLVRALDILADKPAMHAERARILSSYARLLLRRGAHAEAEALLRGQVALERTLHGAATLTVVEPLEELALSVVGRRDFEHGERLFGEVVALMGATDAPTERSIRFETQLADTYRQMGELDRALDHYRRALAGRRSIAGVDDLDTANLTTRIEELSRAPVSVFGA
jgi:tetratricopeptide (TPR) repeat protein